MMRPATKAITVRDVAKVAGVSVATVSRVLNGNDTVDLALKDKVTAAAARLKYTPHAAARALALRTATTVGAVIPTLENANFAVGVGALQKRLSEAGYTLLLGSSNYDPDEEFRQIQSLTAHALAGFMLVGSRRDRRVYETLHMKGIPYVNTWVLDGGHPSIGFDNGEIGRTAARHLLALGHTQFAVIAQNAPNDRAESRIAGIREELATRGLAIPPERFVEHPHQIAEGQRALRRLMALPQPPTAIIASDVLAFGALAEAIHLRIDVPGRLSILGIQDIEFAAHLNPPLTAIRLPAEDIGTHAAEFLLAAIAGHVPAQTVPIPHVLIERGSTGPAPPLR
jgi:LacI family transcriptional regulator